MKVVYDLTEGYPDDIDHYLKYHEMEDDSESNIMFFGYHAINDSKLKEKYKHYDRKIAATGEQPCAFLTGRQDVINLSADTDNYFDKIYTICPYTAEWLNAAGKQDKFETAIIPYNINDIPEKQYEKEFDSIYWGGVHHYDHIHILEAMRQFKSNMFTVHPSHWSVWHTAARDHRAMLSPNGNTPNDYWTMKKLRGKLEEDLHMCANQITGLSTPRREMWEVLRKTKIFIVTNKLYLSDEHIENVKAIPSYSKNKAFSHIEQGIVPQMKTRVVEAAFNKTLSLVKEDPWNVVEHWFEPEKDFLYYKDDEQLPSLVKEISDNWEKYVHITENAYNKAIENYTAQKLFKRFSGE